MKIVMYCQQILAQAPRPGQSAKTVRFQLVPATPAGEKTPATLAPSASLFQDGAGGAAMDLVNVTEEVAATFKEGKIYTFTIPDKPDA